MTCKQCNNDLPTDARYCHNCGKEIGASQKISMDVKKIEARLKNIGSFVSATGLLTIIINVGIYLWSILDKSFIESGLSRPELIGITPMIITGIVFIILGIRIAKHVDRKIKLYLQILLGLSGLLFIYAIATGGSVGMLFILLIAYLISSLIWVGKAMRMHEFSSKLSDPQYRLDNKGWIIFSLASALVIIAALFVDISQWWKDPVSRIDLVKETVDELKAETIFPSQIDENTKLVDVTAETNAIRYHYILSGVDVDILSNDLLKSNLKKGICTNADMIRVLNLGLGMEYAYVVENSDQKYLVSFAKSDCSQ